MEGLVLAHGGEPTRIGVNNSNSVDANGVYFVRNMISVVEKAGSGWVSYQVRHPSTGLLSNKDTYVERVPEMNYWVSGGVYTEIRKENAQMAMA